MALLALSAKLLADLTCDFKSAIVVTNEDKVEAFYKAIFFASSPAPTPEFLIKYLLQVDERMG